MKPDEPILNRRGLSALLSIALLAVAVGAYAAEGAAPLEEVAREVQSKVVKLFGAGGLRGLEAYQSGILISPEGHVLTVWSYVLDADDTTVVLDDGRRYTAHLVAADPLTEIAVLKCDDVHEPLPHFDLSAATGADVGTRVLAFSNLFGIATGDEPVSMLHGSVSAIAPLAARRGAFSTHFHGDVYVVDAATNNPGAAGGALTDQQGRLLGMLGKELRSEVTGTWLNYALPVEAFAPTVEAILAGRFTPPDVNAADRPENPLTLAALGIVLVPDVVARTPPYVDRVLPDSPAALAGLKADDLLVMIDGQVTASCQDVAELVGHYEHDVSVKVAVLRDESLRQFDLQVKPLDQPPGDESPNNQPTNDQPTDEPPPDK
jgi:S1-C subfamily serine protease